MRFLAESGFLLLLRYDSLLCDLVGIWQRHWARQYCNNVSSIAKAAFKTLWCFEALKFSTGIGWDNIHHLHKDQCTWHLWPSINTKSLGELTFIWNSSNSCILWSFSLNLDVLLMSDTSTIIFGLIFCWMDSTCLQLTCQMQFMLYFQSSRRQISQKMKLIPWLPVKDGWALPGELPNL